MKRSYLPAKKVKSLMNFSQVCHRCLCNILCAILFRVPLKGGGITSNVFCVWTKSQNSFA